MVTTNDNMSSEEHSQNATKTKKKKGLSLSSLKSPFKLLGKTYCKSCHKKCSGEVLRVNDLYFHNGCFTCKGCSKSLSQGGFFTKDKDHFCGTCYQSTFGTKCAKCSTFVEGEVVTALGKTYCYGCFKCAGCNKPFPTGERVTFTGKSCLCQKCADLQSSDVIQHPDTKTATTTTSTAPSAKKANNKESTDGKICAGCGQPLKDGQALMALDKHYHVWCFKCKSCGELLHGEYMGKDGQPYCEKCYQNLFGVKCTYCGRFISGKVLQAGENNHFHPTCARCTKCGEPFGDGEEMFLQGAAIWHPRCGPGPDESIVNINGSGLNSYDYDRTSNVSEQPPYVGGSRASSPGLRRPYTPGYCGSVAGDGRVSRSASTTGGNYGFFGDKPALYHSSSTYSLRRPIDVGDRTGSSSNLQHFHLPNRRQVRSSSQAAAGSHHARFGQRSSAMEYPPVPSSRQSSRPGSRAGSSAGFRPVSAPPKPGYTQKSATLPTTPSSIVPPYRTTLHSPFGDQQQQQDGRVSQASFASSMIPSDMSYSRTYTHGFPHFQHSTPKTPSGVTEYKEYPLHLLLTSNFKMPPDVDRCSLEKHLSDADFQMVFQMSRDEFYRHPLWRRNDLKRRVKLFWISIILSLLLEESSKKSFCLMTMMKKNLSTTAPVFVSFEFLYISCPPIISNHRHAAFVFLFYACKNDAAIVLYV